MLRWRVRCPHLMSYIGSKKPKKLPASKECHLGLRKGAWTKEEDALLRKCMEKYGDVRWSLISKRAGLNRCRKSCRLRWLNYLCPNIKRSKFEDAEVDLIIRLHKLLGNSSQSLIPITEQRKPELRKPMNMLRMDAEWTNACNICCWIQMVAGFK